MHGCDWPKSPSMHVSSVHGCDWPKSPSMHVSSVHGCDWPVHQCMSAVCMAVIGSVDFITLSRCNDYLHHDQVNATILFTTVHSAIHYIDMYDAFLDCYDLDNKFRLIQYAKIFSYLAHSQA